MPGDFVGLLDRVVGELAKTHDAIATHTSYLMHLQVEHRLAFEYDTFISRVVPRAPRAAKTTPQQPWVFELPSVRH